MGDEGVCERLIRLQDPTSYFLTCCCIDDYIRNTEGQDDRLSFMTYAHVHKVDTTLGIRSSKESYTDQ